VARVNTSSYLGRPKPPFRTGLCFTRDVSFFVSPLVLQAPSTDRPETLPHGRNLAEFYNPTPKTPGVLPQKNFGAKNMRNFSQFWTTSDFDREYHRISQDIQNRKTLQTMAIPPAFAEKSPVNFGPLTAWNYM